MPGLMHVPTAWCDGVPELAPNPYLEELYGDSDPCWMCQCERESAADDV